MAVYQIQPSFAAGELSPAMAARVDLAKYAIGTRTMRNFYVHPHGGASNRAGTEFIAATKYPDKLARLIKFEFSTLQAYVLEFGHMYIRFFKDGGQVVYPAGHPQAGEIVEIASPYTEGEVAYLKTAQSADVMYITHSNHPPQQLSRTDHHAWTLTAFPYKNGPFLDPNLDETKHLAVSAVTGTNLDITSDFDIFLAGHVGALFKLTHYVEGSTVAYAASTNGSSTAIKCKGTWKLISHGTWTGKLKVERSKDNGSTWQAIRFYSSAGDFNANDSGTEGELCQLRVTAYGWSSGTANVDLSSYPYNLDGIVKITGVTGLRAAKCDVISELGGTGNTDDWREGAWSDVRGYPACVVFDSSDRIASANSLYQPQTIWFSKIGDYVNFASGSPPKDDDAITATLVSRQVNELRSLVALGDIIGLTSSSEWEIGPSGTNSVLTPNTIRARIQGYRGAAWVDPAVVGERILYVQDKGSTVRDLGYDLYSDKYTGNDLSILSRHLVQRYEIYEWAYQQEPDSILWMIRSDGVLLGMTYLREQEVIAWHRHDTDGLFESVCAIPGADRDEVWFIAQRLVNGQVVRYVERMAERLPNDLDVKYSWFVDCGLRHDGAPIKEITNLHHLEGKEVAVLADGNVLPRKTVTDGKIILSTTSAAYSVVTAGLPITAELETLNIEVQTQEGTAQGRPKRIPEVLMRIENSRGGKLGPDPAQLDDLAAMVRDVWDEALPLYSGDIRVAMAGGYNSEGRVLYRQEDPLPVTILAIIPKVVM